MAVREAYLVAFAQVAVQAISGKPREAQALPMLQSLVGGSADVMRSIQEMHWLGGEDEYWLGRLGEQAGFGPGLARFYWPATPLLTHLLLQSSARAIESGEREMILLAQESAGQAVGMLLASTTAAEQGRFSTRVRVGGKFALAGGQDALLQSVRSTLESAGSDHTSVRLIGSSRRINGQESALPGVEWLLPRADLPGGDFFLVAALARRMEEKQMPAAAILSSGAQKSALMTILERAA